MGFCTGEYMATIDAPYIELPFPTKGVDELVICILPELFCIDAGFGGL